ncbi:hypothetical protein, partial [Azospirillum brasilense]|uniref:hypothetical protein n=1 Tax=Azospirillum brasilense TaxID=192 RepID=UPI001B3BE72B
GRTRGAWRAVGVSGQSRVPGQAMGARQQRGRMGELPRPGLLRPRSGRLGVGRRGLAAGRSQ